jgi:hypothetical protein
VIVPVQAAVCAAVKLLLGASRPSRSGVVGTASGVLRTEDSPLAGPAVPVQSAHAGLRWDRTLLALFAGIAVPAGCGGDDEEASEQQRKAQTKSRAEGADEESASRRQGSSRSAATPTPPRRRASSSRSGPTAQTSGRSRDRRTGPPTSSRRFRRTARGSRGSAVLRPSRAPSKRVRPLRDERKLGPERVSASSRTPTWAPSTSSKSTGRCPASSTGPTPPSLTPPSTSRASTAISGRAFSRSSWKPTAPLAPSPAAHRVLRALRRARGPRLRHPDGTPRVHRKRPTQLRLALLTEHTADATQSIQTATESVPPPDSADR